MVKISQVINKKCNKRLRVPRDMYASYVAAV